MLSGYATFNSSDNVEPVEEFVEYYEITCNSNHFVPSYEIDSFVQEGNFGQNISAGRFKNQLKAHVLTKFQHDLHSMNKRIVPQSGGPKKVLAVWPGIRKRPKLPSYAKVQDEFRAKRLVFEDTEDMFEVGTTTNLFTYTPKVSPQRKVDDPKTLEVWLKMFGYYFSEQSNTWYHKDNANPFSSYQS